MDTSFLNASDGSGDAAIMRVQSDRSPGDFTIDVDTIDNIPDKFIGTYGDVLATNFLNPATKVDFYGHISGSDIIIDGFAPGNADSGNTEGQVVIVKPNTHWANIVADFIQSIDIKRLLPTATIMPFAGPTAPTGFLIADGAAVNRDDYAALFDIIGVTYGAGNGTTTFNLPDARGRSLFGKDGLQTEFDTIGESGGQKTVQAHQHANYRQGFFPAGTGSLALNDRSGDAILLSDNAANGVNGEYVAGNPPLGSSFGSGANNLNPYLVVNYIIKT